MVVESGYWLHRISRAAYGGIRSGGDDSDHLRQSAPLVPAPRPRAFPVGFDASRSSLAHERQGADAF